MFKKEIRALIAAFFLISLGGFLLHVRIHPLNVDIYNWIPAIFGLLASFLLPFLFNYKKTVSAAYLINFSSVVIGTILMAMYSIEHWEPPATFVDIILRSTIPDIIILAAKLPLAHFILRFHYPAKD